MPCKTKRKPRKKKITLSNDWKKPVYIFHVSWTLDNGDSFERTVFAHSKSEAENLVWKRIGFKGAYHVSINKEGTVKAQTFKKGKVPRMFSR